MGYRWGTAAAGLLAHRPLWVHYLGSWLGRLGFEVLYLPIGPLFVLGAALLIAAICPHPRR